MTDLLFDVVLSHMVPVTHNSFAEENQVKLKSQHS